MRRLIATYVVIAVAIVALMTYAIFERLMYDVPLVDICSVLLSIVSFIAGRTTVNNGYKKENSGDHNKGAEETQS